MAGPAIAWGAIPSPLHSGRTPDHQAIRGSSCVRMTTVKMSWRTAHCSVSILVCHLLDSAQVHEISTPIQKGIVIRSVNAQTDYAMHNQCLICIVVLSSAQQ